MIRKITPEDIIIKIDSREKKPLRFPLHLRTEVAALKSGDYSVVGLENIVTIERKGLQDLINCIGADRERFEKNLDRLKGFRCRAIVVEAAWIEIEQQRYRGNLHPNSAIGSLMSWIADGFPIVMAGDPTRAAAFTAKILFHAARNAARGEYEGCEEFLESIKEKEKC